MSNEARFKVDSRLSAILGKDYTSCERALRELVDNSWDAEARRVDITLPMVMTSDPIVIEDDGHGMKEKELRQEYLNVANPRINRKGERTPHLNRLVKGQRGIGKFAGLVLADVMEVKTWAGGEETTLLIDRRELELGDRDIETIPLPISRVNCNADKHGTRVTLRELNPRLSFPHEQKLREVLSYDYGKESGIEICINGNRVANYAVKGESFSKKIILADGRTAELRYTIADKPLPKNKAGLILREENKSIGKPHFWGLENNDQLSQRLRQRVVGEIIVPKNSLELTASGADVIEGDKAVEEISQVVCEEVPANLEKTHAKEFNLAKARWQRDINNRLAQIPEFRRSIVKERVDRLVRRSYKEGENEEKITVLVDLVLDALELDEYWTVCHTIEDSDKSDVFKFAKALNDFGLADLAFVANQAKRRLEFLDGLYDLTRNAETLESQMHEALAQNLWVFGPQYSIMASNVTLKKIVADYVGKHYEKEDAKHRPDLLLSGGPDGSRLLVEFKRPSIMVDRKAEAQAKEYADTLGNELNISMKILVVGGKVDDGMRQEYMNSNIEFHSYAGIIAQARTNLEWLLKELRG